MQYPNQSQQFTNQKVLDTHTEPQTVPGLYQAAFPAGTAAGNPHFPPQNMPAMNIADKNISNAEMAEKHLKHYQQQNEEKMHSASQQKELTTKSGKQGQDGLDRNIPPPEKPSQNVGMHGVEFTEESQGNMAGVQHGRSAPNAPYAPPPTNTTAPNLSTINVKPGQGTGQPSQDPQHIAGGYAGGVSVDTKNIKPQTEEFKSQAPQQKENITKASRMDNKKLDEMAQPTGNHILGQQAQSDGLPRTNPSGADKVKADMHSEVLKHQDNAKPDYTGARGEKGQSYNEKGVDKLPDATGYGREHRIYPQ